MDRLVFYALVYDARNIENGGIELRFPWILQEFMTALTSE